VGDIAPDDLRAAVAAGVLSEAQAARLAAIAQARRGFRGAIAWDDEPFELFRGFNEVFIAIGVVLLGLGLWGAAALLADGTVTVAAIMAALSWGLAEYLTRRRRMVLPSLLLATAFAGAVALVAAVWEADRLMRVTPPGRLADLLVSGDAPTSLAIAFCGAGAAGAALFYARFRLPFATFLIGGFAFAGLLAGAGLFDAGGWLRLEREGWRALFDLSQSGGLALTTLGFGLAAFAVAMAFDLRDPHRVSRLSACGFWLHLIAAPAIANTVALSAWNNGGASAALLLALVIAAMTLVALIIDRRSFLIAAVVYLSVLLGAALREASGELASVATLIILGAFLTILGAGWARARGAVLRALPGFPLKDRLPPWTETP
jgi:hypothetical protein